MAEISYVAGGFEAVASGFGESEIEALLGCLDSIREDIVFELIKDLDAQHVDPKGYVYAHGLRWKLRLVSNCIEISRDGEIITCSIRSAKQTMQMILDSF